MMRGFCAAYRAIREPRLSATAPSAPRAFPALRNRGFRIYFFLFALSMMADSVEHVISYWMMFQKFQSPALAGFAVVSHWLPFLFFSVYSGALADRFDPRRIVQVGMACFITASLGWGYFLLTDSLEMWHAMVLLVIHGFAGVLWHPSGQVLVHDMVSTEDLPSAVRLIATARWLGLLAGPAAGAGMMLAFGPTYGILINAALYLPMVLWMWRAPYGPRFRPERKTPPRAVRGVADIVQTIRDVAGDRTIVSMTLLAGCASLFVGNAYQAQMPEFAHGLGHEHADLSYSALLAADAAGALLAGLLLEGRNLLQPSRRSAFVLAMCWCVAIAGFAMSRSYALSLVLLFAAGFLELSFNAMAQSLVQLRAPDRIRGRVIGLYNMSSLGLRAFAGVTVGLLGSLIGIHWSLALSAMVLLAVTISLAALSMRAR
jgi:MFS family permease